MRTHVFEGIRLFILSNINIYYAKLLYKRLGWQVRGEGASIYVEMSQICLLRLPVQKTHVEEIKRVV